MNAYRNLNEKEIQILTSQNCSAESWDSIKVKEGFDAHKVVNTKFTGTIKLGNFNNCYCLEGGLKRESGIYNAKIHNCTIGDDVYIGDIRNYIANYQIGNNTYIENVDLLVVTKKSSFGNGTLVATLNEGGGREVPICDILSAHTAYMMSLYRHSKTLIGNIHKLIEKYCDSVTSEVGIIGNNVVIKNCGTIKNVKIGDNASLESASELVNGSINSNASAPVFIGTKVIAKDFIISSGSEITEGSMIDRCFVGQACQIGKQYSATDTLFFCNCQGFHGESASIFAGPFTVSHHKSSLLIAGMFSFLNAGSGSNQSNHMYKLGPIHQGIVERGSKTTSDSYILWPAKIGAFTLIMGRHTDHPDTTNLPFSYLIEHDNESRLVPGANLRSVGTIRDAQKWPKRDKRTDSNKLDQINFNLLSPYTIQKMIEGINILKSLQKIAGFECEKYYYHNTVIKISSLKKGIQLYNMGITKFLGNSIIKRLENTRFKSIEEIRERLKPDTEYGLGEWVDMAGLILPKRIVEELILNIKNEKYNSLEELNAQYAQIQSSYYNLEWTWAIKQIEVSLDKTIDEITIEDIIKLVNDWKKAVIDLDNILYEDAKKEFTLTVQTGFGADGDDEEKQKDFENVRGGFNSNPFVLEVKDHILRKEALGNELIERIKDI